MNEFVIIITDEDGTARRYDGTWQYKMHASRRANRLAKTNHLVKVFTSEDAQHAYPELFAAVQEGPDEPMPVELFGEYQPIPENVMYYITNGQSETIRASWKRIAEKKYGIPSVAFAIAIS